MAEYNMNNVEVQYTHLLEPNTRFEPAKYQVTLGPLTPEQVEQLEKQDLGHLIQTNKEYSPCINMSSKVHNPRTGALNPVPEYVGPDLQPFTRVIGRGSTINVSYFTFVYQGTGATYATLTGVQVVTEVEVPEGERVGFVEIA